MILDKFRIDGQIAVITGGTRGIGRAITLALAEAGAHVFVVSRKPDAELKSRIENLGRRYLHHVADLTRRNEAKKVIPAAIDGFGDVHILINNAGIIRRSPAAEYSESDWDNTLEIDLSAAFILSQAAGRIMLEKKRGKVVNIGSVLSFQGGLNVVAYAASKHGVAGLTKALANEWAGKGVNVNAIAPGWFSTELTLPIQENKERNRTILERIPAGRWGDAYGDISGAAVFLASPASDFLNGVILPVDGGWMSW